MDCENERLLFPKIQLVKKEIRERFLRITRFIYQHHPVYMYKEKEKESEILIQDGHSFSNKDGKLVKLIAKIGSYSFQLNDTLRNNFSSEVYEDGKLVGNKTQFLLIIPITVLVQSYAEEESSDVADELVQLVIHLCRSYYTSLGLIPKSGNVSETDEVSNEQKIFQTTISFIFEVPWTTIVKEEGKEIIDQIFMLFDRPKSNPVVNYIQPGVAVMRGEEDVLSFRTYKHSMANVTDE